MERTRDRRDPQRLVSFGLSHDVLKGFTIMMGGRAVEAAQEVIRTGEPQMVRVDLTEDLLSLSPAVCGGTMEIFVEAISE